MKKGKQKGIIRPIGSKTGIGGKKGKMKDRPPQGGGCGRWGTWAAFRDWMAAYEDPKGPSQVVGGGSD